MNKPSSRFFYGVVVAAGSLMLALAVSQALAIYSEPPCLPPASGRPDCNPPEPLNVGAVDQTKSYNAATSQGDIALQGGLAVQRNAFLATLSNTRVHVGGISTDARADIKLDVGTYLKAGATVVGNIIAGVKDPVQPTDAANKRYVDAATSRPQYSQTCIDWSAKSWDSMSECIHDGRWHSGSPSTLLPYIAAGASTKLFFSVAGNNVNAECNTTLYSGSTIICTNDVHWGGDTSSVHLDAYAYYSDGRIYHIYSKDLTGSFTNATWAQQIIASGVTMTWYIKF